jgi:hypothetical protein
MLLNNIDEIKQKILPAFTSLPSQTYSSLGISFSRRNEGRKRQKRELACAPSEFCSKEERQLTHKTPEAL